MQESSLHWNYFKIPNFFKYYFLIPNFCKYYFLGNERFTNEAGVRSYDCGFCGKLFKCLRILNSHSTRSCNWNPQSKGYQKHNLKPFTCYECGAGYMRKSGLNFHIRYECGRVQQCNQCGATFLHYGSLYTHRKRCNSIDRTKKS